MPMVAPGWVLHLGYLPTEEGTPFRLGHKAWPGIFFGLRVLADSATIKAMATLGKRFPSLSLSAGVSYRYALSPAPSTTPETIIISRGAWMP
jgi:hypothetical protein